jgi:ATP-binding cassette subfamily F protein uup
MTMQMSRLGSKILELENICKEYDGRTLLHDFSYTFKRGEKIGLIGRNGAGKSTLLNIIMELTKPDKGRVKTGETVVFGYYSQMGMNLPEDKRVIDVAKEIAEYVETGNGNWIGVSQFLNHFQFTGPKQHAFVSKLSGGEKKRLYLMTILLKNPNFLILDEPTNDLDIDTLDLLEQLLQDYKGTVFLVSHDRYFLDNVVTSIIANEGDGFWREYEGGYEDWKIQKARSDKIRAANSNAKAQSATPPKVETKSEAKPVAKAVNQSGVQKLNGKERQELEVLPAQIEVLETEQADIGIAMSNPDLYKNEPELAASMQARLTEITEQLDKKLQRWEQLLSRSES